MSTTPAEWTGEPRVIYHDVSGRLHRLRAQRAAQQRAKRQRELDKNTDSDSDSSGGSSRQQRFVTFMFDLPASFDKKADGRLPEISIIDATGEETRKYYPGRELGPLEAGSVVVLREAGRGTGIAAYFVGEEERQVPCSTTAQGTQQDSNETKHAYYIYDTQNMIFSMPSRWIWIIECQNLVVAVSFVV